MNGVSQKDSIGTNVLCGIHVQSAIHRQMETSTSPLRSASAVKLEPSTPQTRADGGTGSRQILDIIPRQKKEKSAKPFPTHPQEPVLTATLPRYAHYLSLPAHQPPTTAHNATPPRPPPPRGGNPRHPLRPPAHHHHPPPPPKLFLLLPTHHRRNPPTRPPSRGTPRRHLPHRTPPPHRRVPRDHARAPPLSVSPPPTPTPPVAEN